MKIRCTTLFDITKTDVSSRRNHLDEGFLKHDKARGQQSNFETLLQIIGLRSQPENISIPEITTTRRSHWGTHYRGKTFKSWTFTFTVDVPSVFKHDGDELGYLKMDCTGVPMITDLDEVHSMESKMLDSSKEYRNITFEVVDE
jgi:hypothetical protein